MKDDKPRTKAGEAMHRDWEQTKADFSKNKGQELNQDVNDTVGQMAGTKHIPPEGVPNPKDSDLLDKKRDRDVVVRDRPLDATLNRDRPLDSDLDIDKKY